MKYLAFLIFLLSLSKVNGQAADGLKQYSVKKGMMDVSFNKEFARIITAYGHNFAELKSDDKIVSIIDTVYHPNLNFKEPNDGTLTFEKQDINLTISFRLDAPGVKKFFNELSSALPQGFVYTLEYDAEAKQSNYTFFSKPGAKTITPNFSDKIYLITDANNTAVLTFLKYR